MDRLKLDDPVAYTQELELDLRVAELELQKLRTAMDTFTNVIASFVKTAYEQRPRNFVPSAELEVMLERRVIDLMDGAKVTISEAPGTRDVLVRIRENVPHPLWEGRHD